MARITQDCPALTFVLTGSAGSRQVQASLIPKTETNSVPSKTRATTYWKGVSHCQQWWHHRGQGEKREVVLHQRPSLTTQHFCNLRNSPRRKTNQAWEPTWAQGFDANRLFSNICICAFVFFLQKGTVCRHFLCSKVGLPGERTQLPWHRQASSQKDLQCQLLLIHMNLPTDPFSPASSHLFPCFGLQYGQLLKPN